MDDITFVIFTYNEEKRIERVIQNLQGFGQVVLADNKSTDRTLDIAKKHHCKVITREKEYVFVENQELVDMLYDHIDTPWIYWGFADEMVSKETLNEIRRVVKSDQYDIINIDRKNYFYGQFCYNAFQARMNRIFKKHAIDFTSNKIHGFGKPTVDASKIYLLPDKFFVHHFISNTVSSYFNTIDRYTEIEKRQGSKAKTYTIYPFIVAIKLFASNFIMKKGYKAGFPGLTLTLLSITYITMKNMKIYEGNKNISVDSIEKNNDKKRDGILEDL